MSLLIIGGTRESQEDKINQLMSKRNFDRKKGDPNLLSIKPVKSIGIDQIREIKKFVSKKSWNSQKTKLVVVYQAETMTEEAQNAFLKTLEEPPANTMIIITANHKNALLPTILSRCQIIRLKNNHQKKGAELDEYWNQWKKTIGANLDERLKLGAQLNRDDLDNYILSLHQKLVEGKSEKTEIKDWLEKIITAKQMLEDNVNSNRIFDWLMLKL